MTERNATCILSKVLENVVVDGNIKPNLDFLCLIKSLFDLSLKLWQE